MEYAGILYFAAVFFDTAPLQLAGRLTLFGTQRDERQRERIGRGNSGVRGMEPFKMTATKPGILTIYSF